MKLVLHKPLLRPEYQRQYPYYLGFGYLKAYLREHVPEVEVEIVESEGAIEASRPDVVGFSTVTEIWPHLLGVYGRLRRWFDGPVFFGGPHISALPQLLPKGDTVAFMGEAEASLAQVCAHMLRDRHAHVPGGEIPGTAAWRDNNLLLAERAAPLPIDQLPPPADAPAEVYPLTTVRGCIYQCSHCVERATQGKARVMSAQRLADLVTRQYEQRGTTVFEFLDDLFLASRSRLLRFVRILDERGLLDRLYFRKISLIANLIDEEVGQALARMNVDAGMGLESADPDVLGRFKRGSVNREHLERAIEICTRYGVNVNAAMVLGYPGETEAQMRNTIEFYAERIHRTALVYGETYVCQPLPGSLLWFEAFAQKRVSLDMDFSTLRIDADVNHFDSDWHYDNEGTLPRERFMEVLREYDLIRPGMYTKDIEAIPVRPKTDIFVRHYVPEDEARLRARAVLQDWQARDGRPIAVFGAGRHTRKIMPELSNTPVRIAAILDDDPERVGTTMAGIPVFATADISLLKVGAVLISTDRCQDEALASLEEHAPQGCERLVLYSASQRTRQRDSAFVPETTTVEPASEAPGEPWGDHVPHGSRRIVAAHTEPSTMTKRP